MIGPFVLALALGAAEPGTLPLDPAGAASVASSAEVDPALAGSAAPEPALATSVAPTPPPSPPAAAPSLGGWRHAIAVGAQVNWLISNEDSQYQFRSASFGYHGSVGARGAFLDL